MPGLCLSSNCLSVLAIHTVFCNIPLVLQRQKGIILRQSVSNHIVIAYTECLGTIIDYQIRAFRKKFRVYDPYPDFRRQTFPKGKAFASSENNYR